MTWTDDEFETFLRTFKPEAPAALPEIRRMPALLPAAVAIAFTAAIAVGVVWNRWPAESSGPSTPARSTPAEMKDVEGSRPLARQQGSTSASGARRRINPDELELVGRPRKIVDVPPRYPREAQAARIEGVVILEIVIAEDGTVVETRVVQSIPELDQAAIDAVRQWVYTPTVLDGEAVEVEMNVFINFTLS